MVNRKELNPEASPRAAFGARLRGVREARGVTQGDLGDQMENSGQHVSAVETGRKPPTLRFARRADLVLDVGDEFEREWRDLRHGSLLEGFPRTRGYPDRDIPTVVPLVRAYHQLQAEALSQAASVALINEVRKGILWQPTHPLAGSPPPTAAMAVPAWRSPSTLLPRTALSLCGTPRTRAVRNWLSLPTRSPPS